MVENYQKKNTSGVTGVYFNKARHKWQAYITLNGVKKSLGYFEDKQNAIEARKRFEKEHKSSSN